MKQATFKKLGQKVNGAPRLWLEGLRLAECGFDVGVKFIATRSLKENQITLKVATSELLSQYEENGTQVVVRTVSKRQRPKWDAPRPIIDVVGNEIKKSIGEGIERVQIIYRDGEIIVQAHHEDVAKAERKKRFLDEAKEGRFTLSSMCTGGGVAAKAVHDAVESLGFKSKHAFVADICPKYLQAGLNNNPSMQNADIVFEGAMEEINPDLIPKSSIMQFSLPCTGHSLSGKSKNKIKNAEDHESAATSVFGMINFVRKSQPAVIISENVKEAQDSATYSLIRGEFKRMGYKVAEVVLDGSHAGTLENRVRYWLVAIDEGLLKGQDFSLTVDPLPRQHETLGEIMEPLSDDDPAWSVNQYLKDKADRDLATGKGFAKRQLLDASATKVGTIGRHYNKRRSTEPFIVREANGVQMERLLTVKEHAGVKNIDASLVSGIPKTIAHEIMGQSILPDHCVSVTKLALGAVIAANSNVIGTPTQEA